MAGITLTYVNPTTFTVMMDRTDEFQVGRRVKFDSDISPYERYGTILTSTYSSLTTVVLTDDSDDLHSTSDEVWYGIISASESSSSIPIHTHDGDEGSGGTLNHTIASHSDTTATGSELNELTDGSNTTLHGHSNYEPVDTTILRQADVDDTPVNDDTIAPISSNWAFDHTANSDAHHSESHTIASHSDTTATGSELNELTDGSDTTLHGHSNDRNRTNHTGTQTASTISDFDTEVSNNSSVVANTAKITNATHTGEVTGDGALTITDNVVDEANLKLDEGPTNDYVLTADSTKSGGMKWAAGGSSSPLTTKGDIIVYTTEDARLPIGTDNFVLTADSSESTGMKWASGSSASSPLTTKGDIYIYGTDDDRLPIGTNDQVLTADSSESTGMKWADASGGGGSTLDPIPDTDLTGSGDIVEMTVTTNDVGIGCALSMDSNGNYIESVSSSIPCMALANETGTGTKEVLLRGFMRNDAWDWDAIGQPIYVSSTSGNLTQSKPFDDMVQQVGIVTHADRIWFNPNYRMEEPAVEGLFVFGGSTYDFDVTYCQNPDVCSLTDDKVVMIYSDGIDGINVKVGDINHTNITWSSESVVATHTGATRIQTICKLNNRMAVCVYINSSGAGEAKVIEIDGTTINQGTGVSFGTINSLTLRCCRVDGTHIVIMYRLGTGKAYCRVASISGTTLTFGSAVEVSSTSVVNYFDISCLNNSKIIIGYSDPTSGAYNGKCVLGSISGTTLTLGSAVEFESNVILDMKISNLSRSKFFISYNDETDVVGKCVVGEVVGTVISFGTAVTFNTTDTDEIAASVVTLNDDTVCITFRDTDSDGTTLIAKIVGTNITIGTEYEFRNADIQEQLIGTTLCGKNKICYVWVEYNDIGSSVIGYIE